MIFFISYPTIIRQLRFFLEETTKDFGSRFEKDSRCVKAWELGEKIPSKKEIKLLCELFHKAQNKENDT